MKQLIQFCSVFSVALFSFLVSCTNNSNNRQSSSSNISINRQLLYPHEGIQCYESVENKDITHVRLSINKENINGILLVKDEVWGSVVYDFSGKIINDSTYNIVLHAISKNVEQKWILQLIDNYIEISGISLIATKLLITPIICDKFPDVSDVLHYPSVEDIEREIEGGTYENTH